MTDAAQIVTVATLDGAPLRAEFPLHTTVFGVAAVVISAHEYRRLLANGVQRAFEGQLKALRSVRRLQIVPLASTVERDPDVAAFLRGRFDRADTIEESHAACLAEFGADRTPSEGRIKRFRSKARRGA